MQPDKNKEQKPAGKHEHPLPQEISNKDKKTAVRAHDQAEKDMAEDADLSVSSPNDDLDEGETARLGEDVSDII
jgi:hypothetical protein